MQEDQAQFRELENVRQEPGHHRRWFESNCRNPRGQLAMELIVWDRDTGILGFQLVYTLAHRELALTWRPDSGFKHSLIDAGDSSPLKNMSPILIDDASAVPWEYLETTFLRHASTLEPVLRDLVLAHLHTRM